MRQVKKESAVRRTRCVVHDWIEVTGSYEKDRSGAMGKATNELKGKGGPICNERAQTYKFCYVFSHRK